MQDIITIIEDCTLENLKKTGGVIIKDVISLGIICFEKFMNAELNAVGYRIQLCSCIKDAACAIEHRETLIEIVFIND